MLNRRSWIKSSLMAAGSLAILPSISAERSRSVVVGHAQQGVLRDITLPIGDSGMAAVKARLSANENPYGPSASVRQAVADAIVAGNRYGHEDAAKLMDMIAEREGVTKEHIMLGPGSTDLLEKTAISQFLKGGNIVSADPSYMSVVNTARAIGADWKPIPLTADYAHDVSAMASAVDSDTRLVYVCNPNNPIGSLTNAAVLKEFCRDVSKKVPVFVDEAYLEFLPGGGATDTMVGLIQEGSDVIIARTFSKIYGLAGLRIGYVVAQPERIKALNAIVRGTMGLCVTSLAGAVAALNDTSFAVESRELNMASRDYVIDKLKDMGYAYIPSVTNFVIFPINGEAANFQKNMRDGGVSIRMFQIADKPWCRVSMGTMEEMQLFADVLQSSQA